MLVFDGLAKQHHHQGLAHNIHQNTEQDQAHQHGHTGNNTASDGYRIKVAIARCRQCGDAPPHGSGNGCKEALVFRDGVAGDRIDGHEFFGRNRLSFLGRMRFHRSLTMKQSFIGIEPTFHIKHQGAGNHHHREQSNQINPQIDDDGIGFFTGNIPHRRHGRTRQFENAQNPHHTQQTKDLRALQKC